MAVESVSASTRPMPHQVKVISKQFRERLLSPWPRVTTNVVIAAMLIALMYLWGIKGTEADPAELVEGIPNIVNFVIRLFPPQLEFKQQVLQVPLFAQDLLGSGTQVEFPFPIVVLAIVETIQMAIIGTTLAILFSVPFGLLAARNTSPHPVVYSVTRMILNINRAVPDIIFALIFVSAVGLGPFGGVLALGIGSIGFIGKLYAESIEAIDPQQVLALRATGASSLEVFRYAVIPQALPLIASYSLLLFETNVRSATILGIVGAGGVGFTISKYMSLFQYRRLMGALILIILTVTVVDRVSGYLRKKII